MKCLQGLPATGSRCNGGGARFVCKDAGFANDFDSTRIRISESSPEKFLLKVRTAPKEGMTGVKTRRSAGRAVEVS